MCSFHDELSLHASEVPILPQVATAVLSAAKATTSFVLSAGESILT
jgi:hypothetical protein